MTKRLPGSDVSIPPEVKGINMGLSSVAVFWILISVTSARIVQKNLDLEVINGRTIYIRKTHLQFATNPGEVCKVQVVENEPIYQRVGELTPKVFDCDYLKRAVRYQHNGSPLLSKDVVKLRVSRLLVNETIQEILYLRIHIISSECDVIQKGRQELRVSQMNGVSNPISKDIIQFNYDRLFHTKCEVRIETKKFNFPEIGQLVIQTNSPGQEPKYEPTGVIISDCNDFLLKKIRYQHLVPPTPDIDYIPLLVIITDKRSRYTLKQEQYWLPVKIGGAFENQVPQPSHISLYVLEVDQFVTTNLLSTAISATDSETNNDKLIFNITKPPEKGFIAHLNDESKPVESFYQSDIGKLNIAYQPPNSSFSDRQTFIVEFIVYDSHNGVSQIIQVLLSIRVSHTTAPRISWNMGLTMLEGQSRTIDKNSLQIVASDTLHLVRITLSGGLHHGRLYVDGKPGYSFSYTEIINNKVIYRHDDSETTRDYIRFQVSDGSHSTRFKLPIEILPKDDSSPVLINNVVFEVQEGQTISIYSFMLEAYDGDSGSDYVKYNITNPPKAGQIQKRKDGERAGWEVQKFEQKDLYQGDIYYKHMGDEAFDDSFDFVLIDNGKPYPNISPTQTVTIKITPVDDQPPKPVPGITRSLTINETDITFITPQMLSYIDVEDPRSEITYTLTSDIETLDSLLDDGNLNQTDAGHLFFTDDMIMLMKDPSVPKLKMFSQEAVNHNKVAYMPPINDIGLKPVDVHFEYSVTDAHGTTVEGEQFFLTVLPVDNQAPILETKKLFVKEGGTVLLSEKNIKAKDKDTIINQLKFIIIAPPKHGVIEKYGQKLSEGNMFRWMDIGEFGIMYTHNGFETLFDEFKIIATDGHQNSSISVIYIAIQPVDDENPIFSQSNALKVNESDAAFITSDHLKATDIDTNDDKLIFQIVDEPLSGSVLLDERESRSFTQLDIKENRVKYQHNGDEIGHQPEHDVISFVVMDKNENYGEFLETPHTEQNGPMETYDLNITIIPVNNRPPDIILGSAIFNCEEGGRHPLTRDHLWADDLDTPQENLVFRILPPTFGVIEDNTPREGYEKQISVPVTSFTLQRLSNGNIYYVQSDHRGIEPTADTFLVRVSDGKHNSAEVPFLIAILPTNDEPPEVRVNNFSCSEGDMFSLSKAVLDVVDLDLPTDEVMISITSPPTHGMLIDEMEMKRAKRSSKRSVDYAHLMHEMDHMSEFSLHDWSGHRIQPAYIHDGTENAHDKFQLKISDGKHVYQKEMNVNIVLVNDEKPKIISNKGMSIELGDTKIISNIELYATDADSSNDELFYILYSIPNQGKLQKKNVEWITLQIGDLFTENDVSNNWIRYTQSNIFSTKGKDSFRFSVTDGTWTTKRQNFEINIRNKEKSAVHIVTGVAKVNEGDRVFITTDVLSARDGFNRPEDISYKIISEPMYGKIEHIGDQFSSIKYFSQLDLMSRKIIYRHTTKEDSVIDYFTVEAISNIDLAEGVVTIQINPVDVELPSLTIFPFTSGASINHDSHLTVFRGSAVSINDMILSISDPDSPKSRLRIVITSYPEHGELTLGHEIVESSGIHEITQIQLESAELMYENNGDQSDIDRFFFLVTDGAHSGYLINGKLMKQPTIFNIRIEQLDDTPPRITVNIPTTSIELKGESSSQYVVYIDSHNLIAIDDGDNLNDPNDILFSVTEPPSFGMLKKTNKNGAALPVSEFTMADLNDRKLLYMIDRRLNITNDKFLFDVQDDWGNVLMATRFFMRWSRVELLEKHLTICESDSQSEVTIKRYGDLSASSFIGVKTITSSATEEKDFLPSSARQVQFDPGTSTQKWIFKVPNDGIKERKEKFELLLHSPINTVLESKHKDVTVKILDSGSYNCQASLKTSISEYHVGKTMPDGFAKTKFDRKINSSKKKRKRKNRRKKLKRKKSSRLVKDQSVVSGTLTEPSSGKTRKYGKLGKGVTVPPSTYSRNQTHRKWTYHGLIPITIDRESAGEKKPVLEDFKQPPYSNIPGEELINDEPHQGKKVTDKNFDTGNSESEFSREPDIPIPPDKPPPSHTTSPKSCTVYTYDRLYYDPTIRSLMRCTSGGWVQWSPTKSRATTPLKPTDCSKGWLRFEARCFYVHSGAVDSTGESWNSAQRRCREDFGAQLATISSKQHMNWLRKKSGKQKMWIGLNRKLSSIWEWAGGDVVNFTNWKVDYKKHFSKPGRLRNNDADCAIITERKRWIAKNCSPLESNTGFICMKEMLS